MATNLKKKKIKKGKDILVGELDNLREVKVFSKNPPFYYKQKTIENDLRQIYAHPQGAEFDASIKKPEYRKEKVADSLVKIIKEYLKPEYFRELSVTKLLIIFAWFFSFSIRLIYYRLKSLIADFLKFKPTKKKIERIEEKLGIEDIFSAPPAVKVFGHYLPQKWFKNATNFLIISLFLILPLQALTFYQDVQNTKNRVLALTNEAFKYFQKGQQAAVSFDLNAANLQFAEAKQNFVSAQKEISNLNFVTTELLKIIPGQGNVVSAGRDLIAAGKSFASSAEYLTAGIKNLTTASNSANQTYNFYNNLIKLEENLNLSIIEFLKAKELINYIDVELLPQENQQALLAVKKYLPTLEAGLKDFYTINQAVLKILGRNYWQRYLVIFQNNNELRATGGFMGSYALLDIDRGRIKNLEIPSGGTYDLQGSLLAKVASPQPLHLINPLWQFQDANWWPDFPTTAQKIQWFFQESSQPSVDGVIALNATILEKLLGIVGPIEMPPYGRIIDQNNFIAETQKIVELEYDKTQNRPKQFLADFAPKLLNKIFDVSESNFNKLIEVLYQGLKEKEIMLYFNDENLEDLILKLDWGGQLKATNGDYLAVINTNLAGGKTDRVIKEVINHQAEVLVDGSIVDTVQITKTHQGQKGDLFSGVQNNNYLRIYAPEGSTLIAASGFSKIPPDLFETPPVDSQPDFSLATVESKHLIEENSGTEIYNENNKTVFANWLQIKPGETKTVVLKYRLPFQLIADKKDDGQQVFYYSLLIQKQPGTRGSEFLSALKLNNNLIPLAKYPPDQLSGSQKEINFQQSLFTDKYYGVVLVENNR